MTQTRQVVCVCEAVSLCGGAGANLCWPREGTNPGMGMMQLRVGAGRQVKKGPRPAVFDPWRFNMTIGLSSSSGWVNAAVWTPWGGVGGGREWEGRKRNSRRSLSLVRAEKRPQSGTRAAPSQCQCQCQVRTNNLEARQRHRDRDSRERVEAGNGGLGSRKDGERETGGAEKRRKRRSASPGEPVPAPVNRDSLLFLSSLSLASSRAMRRALQW